MEARTARVTSAGSGRGRTSALAAAARAGRWRCPVRRPRRSEEVAAEPRAGGTALVVPLDVTDRPRCGRPLRRIAHEHGAVEARVISAGRNAPQRYWRDPAWRSSPPSPRPTWARSR